MVVHAHILSRVASVLRAGHVLCEQDVYDRCRRTAGPFQPAVADGTRFAILAEPTRRRGGLPDDVFCETAEQAAFRFCEAVGESRAHLAALAAAEQHGIAL